jgi:hypothetical protein
MNKAIWLPTVAVIFMVASASEATANSIVNFSFEQPTTATFTYDPLDPTLAWDFTGRSGVAATTFFTSPPPDGTQAAFIQQYLDQSGNNLSQISQQLSGVALVPTTLSFDLAQRPGFTANPIVVSYGGQTLGTFTPGSTAFSLITINFTPIATSGALSFTSAFLTSGDLGTALDAVTFTQAQPVPEPATLVLMGTGSGLLALRRRWSQRGKRATS